MASSANRYELSDLQRATLREFFARETGFFLTGGAALVGYYLHHEARLRTSCATIWRGSSYD
jgi:hypothetical protein